MISGYMSIRLSGNFTWNELKSYLEDKLEETFRDQFVAFKMKENYLSNQIEYSTILRNNYDSNWISDETLVEFFREYLPLNIPSKYEFKIILDKESRKDFFKVGDNVDLYVMQAMTEEEENEERKNHHLFQLFMRNWYVLNPAEKENTSIAAKYKWVKGKIIHIQNNTLHCALEEVCYTLGSKFSTVNKRSIGDLIEIDIFSKEVRKKQ